MKRNLFTRKPAYNLDAEIHAYTADLVTLHAQRDKATQAARLYSNADKAAYQEEAERYTTHIETAQKVLDFLLAEREDQISKPLKQLRRKGKQ